MTSRTSWTRAISSSVPLKMSAFPCGSTVIRSAMFEKDDDEERPAAPVVFGFEAMRGAFWLLPPARPMARWRATGAARCLSSKRMNC